MKSRVLAIVDTGYWATGTLGKIIARNFSDEFDFFLVPEAVLQRRLDMLRELLLNCDVVFCLNETGAALLREHATVPLPPVVTWIHHITAWSPEHQTATEISDVVLALTPGWKQAIAQHAGPRPRIEIVRNGVDTNHFQRREVDRGRLGIAADAFLMGFFAARGSDSDGGRKGIDTLLAVLTKAGKEIPKLAILIVGPGWEALEGQIRATGVSPHVFGFTPRSQVPSLYSALNAYVVTSRVEGGPLTVLESMACGTPAISTRVGLVPEVIEDGVNGFSVEIGDVDGFVSAIRTLAGNPELLHRMRKAARATAEQHTSDRTYEPLRGILRGLVRRPLRVESRTTAKWLADPEATSRVSCAAECLARTVQNLRMGRIPAGRAARLLRDMLEGVSLADRARAIAMLKGIAYRVPNQSSSNASTAG
jgi:glycosyltransferase involved in cell wall biosynthesis